MTKNLEISWRNRYKIEQWNQNCPVLHSQHSSSNKNNFTTSNSGNALVSYYYLKVIDFCEVENFRFREDLFSRLGYFQIFLRFRSKLTKFAKINQLKVFSLSFIYLRLLMILRSDLFVILISVKCF